MPNGTNSAKQTLVDEVNRLLHDVDTGDINISAQETFLHALTLMLRMLSPMFMADYVTTEECRSQHRALLRPKKDVKSSIEDNNDDELHEDIGFKIGPLSINGHLSQFIILVLLNIICIAGVVFAIGKAEQWW
jgi:hypothetical protein